MHAVQANDIPVLKLFEFLVASICLFMIEDDVPSEQRELDMFKLTAPQGVYCVTTPPDLAVPAAVENVSSAQPVCNWCHS